MVTKKKNGVCVCDEQFSTEIASHHRIRTNRHRKSGRAETNTDTNTQARRQNTHTSYFSWRRKFSLCVMRNFRCIGSETAHLLDVYNVFEYDIWKVIHKQFPLMMERKKYWLVVIENKNINRNIYRKEIDCQSIAIISNELLKICNWFFLKRKWNRANKKLDFNFKNDFLLFRLNHQENHMQKKKYYGNDQSNQINQQQNRLIEHKIT